MSRGRVIRIDTIMTPSASASEGMKLHKAMVLETAARQLTEAGQNAAVVVDDAGAPVGRIDLPQIISAMVTPRSHEDHQVAAE